MKQREIISYFAEVGGLRCQDWTIKEIRDYIHETFPQCKRVYTSTCKELKRTAQMYQR